MAKQAPVKVDPKELERSQDMWENFTKLMQWSVIATVVILALLGVFFIDWTA